MTPAPSPSGQLPSAAGSISGLGGTFTADPFTGTGRFELRLPTPPGRGGLEPGMALVYSSGAGGSVCGVGWSFGPASITRRTSKGIPEFTPDDTFLLSGDELVPTGDGHFVRRTEGAYARIRWVQRAGQDFWAVTDRDGTRRLFGRRSGQHDGAPGRPVAWHLSEIRDSCDNVVEFEYRYDPAEARSRVVGARWGPYRLDLEYEGRPDLLRSARAGVLLTTSRRLRQATIQVRHRDTGAFVPFDELRFEYRTSPVTGLSLLDAVHRIGIGADGARRSVPSVRFRYAVPGGAPEPLDVTGHAGRSLSDDSLALLDMTGDGLPDLLESTGHGWLLRANRGDGSFSAPVPTPGPATRLTDPGVVLTDVDGTGFPDLVTPDGWYPNHGNGFQPRRAIPLRPALDLDDPDVGLIDLSGDGVGDLLRHDGSAIWFYRSRGAAGWDLPVVRPLSGQPVPRPSDRWTRTADMEGDGLADLVRLSRGSVEVHQNLGFGRFAAARRLPLPERLPSDVDPEHMMLMDVTGTGAADLVVRRGTRTWIFVNGCGAEFLPRIELRTRGLGAGGTVQAVDLLGDGGAGLLFTENGDRRAWTLYQLWQATRPDTLQAIDNGLGGTTEIRYESALVHAARDRALGSPWRYPQPRPIPVISAITRTDRVTGSRVGVRYRYHEGFHDAVEREFRGFAICEQLDTETDDGAGTAPARTLLFHHLGNGDSFADRYAPVAGPPVVDVVPPHPGARRALRGAVAREEIFGLDGAPESGRPYQVTQHAYTVVAVAGPAGGRVAFDPQLTGTDVVLLEREAEPRTTSTRIAYDGFGRSVEVRILARGRAVTPDTMALPQQTDTIERVTTHSYVDRREPDPLDYEGPYSPCYLMNCLSVAESHEIVGSSPARLIGEERSYYDGEPYLGLGHPLAGGVPGVMRGLLSCRLQLALTDLLLDGLFTDAADARTVWDDEGSYLRVDDRSYVQRDRLAHDDLGNCVSSLDALGHRSSIDYDTAHRTFPVRYTDPTGQRVSISTGEFPFAVATVLDSNGNETDYGYDPAGFLSSVTEKGRFIDGSWEGDPPTHPTEIYEIDYEPPLSITTRRRLERAGGMVVGVRYLDGAGQVIESRSQAEDDSAGRPRFRVTGRHRRDRKGLVVTTFPPAFADTADFQPLPDETHATVTTYDPLGRVVRVDHPDGSSSRTERSPWRTSGWDRNDTAGDIDPAASVYGPILPQIRHLMGTPIVSQLDPCGRPIAQQHIEHVSRRTFDQHGELVTVVDARAAAEPSWTMGRDLIGRCFRLRHPASGRDLVRVLDAAGHPIWSREVDATVVRLAFDDLGRPVRRTSDSGAGQVLRAEWIYGPSDDPDPRRVGRLVESRDAAGVRLYTYDWRGSATATTHRFWITGLTSDDWADPASPLWISGAEVDGPLPGLPLQLDGLDDPTALTETVEYDTRGRPVIVRCAGGIEIHETYDTAGYPASLSVVPGDGAEPVVLVASYERDAAGRETGVVHGNGVVLRREVDPTTDRLAGMSIAGPTGVLADLLIVSAPNGLPIAVSDRGDPAQLAPGVIASTRRFRYDRHSRLVGATGLAHGSVTDGRDALPDPDPDPAEYAAYEMTYAYDPAGNVTGTGEYGPEPLLYDPERPDLLMGTAAERDASAYAYDARGNTLSSPRHDVLTYDHDGFLRYAESGTAQAHVRYRGDQPALRVARSPEATTLTAHFGATEYVLVRGPAGSEAHITVRTAAGFVRREVSGPSPGATEIATTHPDEIGSVAFVTDESGGLGDQESYFPYGRTSDRRTGQDRPRFLALDREAVTGLYLVGPRVYDPAIGRFLQPDPRGAAQPDWSPFCYAMGSPMLLADRSGYQPSLLPGLIYMTVQAHSPVELPAITDVTAGQWLDYAPFAMFALTSDAYLPANTPMSEDAVPDRGDPVGVFLGLIPAAGSMRTGFSLAKGVTRLGGRGILAMSASVVESAGLRATTGTTQSTTTGTFNRFYRATFRPRYQLTNDMSTVSTRGGTTTSTGDVTIFMENISTNAGGDIAAMDDLYWEVVRHEGFHKMVTKVADRFGAGSWVNNMYVAGGRWKFYEEFGAFTVGQGNTRGVADHIFLNYNVQPQFTRAMFESDMLLAKVAIGGTIATGTLGVAAVGGTTIGVAGGLTYRYLLADPPAQPVLPPITLE